MKIANTMEIRIQNAFNIINDINCNPGTTITEIAQNRSLSVPTISNIVSLLRNSNMVQTVGMGVSSGGRKPTQLSLNPRFQHCIGVSIAKHTVYLVMTDFAGHILQKEKQYIDFEESDAYWQRIHQLIEALKEGITSQCDIGVALPGFVDDDQNQIVNTFSLGVSTVSIDMIHHNLGDYVAVGDSCRLAAIAQMFGKNDVEDNFFILLSRRVSGLLILNGSILNQKVSSLDIGSMIIDVSSNDAAHGILGSFAEECSASKIIDLLKKEYPISQYEEFFDGIEKGDQDYIRIWDSYLKSLSVALFNIYAFFKTDIVIGGEMAKYLASYTDQIKSYIAELTSQDMIQNLDVQCSKYREYDDAYGAALEIRSLYLKAQLPEILKRA